jgi:hypothetical protein
MLYGRVVAAKQLLVGTATDKVVRGLQHEAYVMSLTAHPNIVPFYGGHIQRLPLFPRGSECLKRVLPAVTDHPQQAVSAKPA